MTWSPSQWKAIAASTIRRLGREKGEAYLSELKAKTEREGVPLIDRDTPRHRRRRKGGDHGRLP